MSQKILVIVLAVVVIAGFAWYFNKTYLQSRATGDLRTAPEEDSNQSDFTAKIVYVVYNANAGTKEIYQTTAEKESQKIFTDADETEKLLKISNLAHLTGEILAIVSNEKIAHQGKLISINLRNSQKKVLEENFGIPSSWSLAPDGKKFVFSQFSNLEDNYGYTLYVANLDGSNQRALGQSMTDIRSPAWNDDSSKVAYLKTSGTSSEVMVANFNDEEPQLFKTLENNIIDWIAFEDGSLILGYRDLGEDLSGTIGRLDKNGKLGKIITYDGGWANFIYSDQSFLGFLISQYTDSIGDLTTGQIYLYNLSQKKKIPLVRGVQVLGIWGG